MYRWKNVPIEIINQTIKDYLLWKSMPYISKNLWISLWFVHKIIKKEWISRTQWEWNSLKRKEAEFYENQVNQRKWKPTWSKWKTWKCKWIIKRPNNTWDKNPQWKWWKTKLVFQIRNSVEYKYWRKKIFERDHYTCVECWRKRRKWDRVIIQADHIYPLCKIMDDYEIQSINDAISCEYLWDINNWRTLCKECHKKTETRWLNQYRRNTRQQ